MGVVADLGGYSRVGEIHPAHAFLSLPNRVVPAPDLDEIPHISEIARRKSAGITEFDV
jgi:hypothetical protein